MSKAIEMLNNLIQNIDHGLPAAKMNVATPHTPSISEQIAEDHCAEEEVAPKVEENIPATPIIYTAVDLGRPTGIVLPEHKNPKLSKNEKAVLEMRGNAPNWPEIKRIRKELNVSKKEAKKILKSTVKKLSKPIDSTKTTIGWIQQPLERYNNKFPALETIHLYTIEEHGFCVKSDVIPKALCEKTIKSMWKWLRDLSKGTIKKHKPDTLVAKNWPMNHRGLIQSYFAGHQQFVWDIREHDNVVQIFEEIWGTRDLVVSFDGINIQKPTQSQAAGMLHLDQGSRRGSGKQCVQGFVSLDEFSSEDGCFQCIANSVKYHAEFFEHFGLSNIGDWFVMSDEHLQWYLDKPDTYLLRVPCPAGGMVLWDSRLVHCGVSPLPGRRNPNRWRYIVYVCMTPRSKCIPEVEAKRKQMFKDLVMTSHCAHDPQAFKMQKPRFGKGIDPADSIIPKPKIRKKWLI